MPFSGYQDFNSDFSKALQLMIAERPGIFINSGYRTPERQAELFQGALAKYGSVAEARRHVAPAPGTYGSQGSRHNFGLAADLGYSSSADEQWAHDNAARFGLNFRMGHEPWHIELLNGKPTAVGNASGQPVANPAPNQGAGGNPNIVIKEAPKPFYDWRADLQQDMPVQQPQIDPGISKVADVGSLLDILSPKQKESSQKLLEKIRGFS